MRPIRTLALAGLFLPLTAALLAQAAGKPAGEADDSAALKALKQLEQHAAQDDIPPDVRANIINKPKIAEQTTQRMIGRQERGNRHIQRGEGLLLAEAKPDPALPKLDLERLRAERIAMYEGKALPPPPAEAAGEAPRTDAAPTAAAEPSGQKISASRRWGGLAAASGLLVIGFFAAAHVWRSQG